MNLSYHLCFNEKLCLSLFSKHSIQNWKTWFGYRLFGRFATNRQNIYAYDMFAMGSGLNMFIVLYKKVNIKRTMKILS